MLAGGEYTVAHDTAQCKLSGTPVATDDAAIDDSLTYKELFAGLADCPSVSKDNERVMVSDGFTCTNSFSY